MRKQMLSTFDREMQEVDFKNQFDKSYKDFLLSELILSLMEEDHKTVRNLAKEVGLSTTVIQKLRSGKQNDIKLSNFINISLACGYHLLLEKNRQQIRLS